MKTIITAADEDGKNHPIFSAPSNTYWLYTPKVGGETVLRLFSCGDVWHFVIVATNDPLFQGDLGREWNSSSTVKAAVIGTPDFSRLRQFTGTFTITVP